MWQKKIDPLTLLAYVLNSGKIQAKFRQSEADSCTVLTRFDMCRYGLVTAVILFSLFTSGYFRWIIHWLQLFKHMHDMNEKEPILNLEAENRDEDKIEVFALPPLLNWALIPTHLHCNCSARGRTAVALALGTLDGRHYRDVDSAPPYPGMGWVFRPNYGKNLLLQI